MPDPKPQYWFSAKSSGLGWGLPTAWQGWLTLLVYVAILAGTGLLFRHGHHLVAHYVVVGVATALLILVCVLKGEPLGSRDRY